MAVVTKWLLWLINGDESTQCSGDALTASLRVIQKLGVVFSPIPHGKYKAVNIVIPCVVFDVVNYHNMKYSCFDHWLVEPAHNGWNEVC